MIVDGETRSLRELEHTSDRMSSMIHGLKSRSCVLHESSDVSVPLVERHDDEDNDDCGDTRALDLIGEGGTRSSREFEHTSDRTTSSMRGLEAQSWAQHDLISDQVALDGGVKQSTSVCLGRAGRSPDVTLHITTFALNA
jgi:hypothetical protein